MNSAGIKYLAELITPKTYPVKWNTVDKLSSVGGIDQYLGTIVAGKFGGGRDALALGTRPWSALNKFIGKAVYNL